MGKAIISFFHSHLLAFVWAAQSPGSPARFFKYPYCLFLIFFLTISCNLATCYVASWVACDPPLLTPLKPFECGESVLNHGFSGRSPISLLRWSSPVAYPGQVLCEPLSVLFTNRYLQSTNAKTN